MLVKINRLEAINKFPIFPLKHYDRKKDEEIFIYPKVFDNYVLTLPSKSFKGHQNLLGKAITTLAKDFGCDCLIFLGDMDTPWLKRFNTCENFQNDLQYLVDNKIGKLFSGALQVNTNQLPTFIKHLSYLVRTNGIVQYVHFTDPQQNIVANICQYGNLHISTKNKPVDKHFKEIIAKSQFTFLANSKCSNKF